MVNMLPGSNNEKSVTNSDHEGPDEEEFATKRMRGGLSYI